MKTAFANYFIRLMLLGLPVVNVVAAALWGFTAGDPDTRAFGRAALCVLAVVTTLLVALAAVLYTAAVDALAALVLP